MRSRTLLCLALLLVLCSCASDSRLVQKATSYSTYYEKAYDRKCVSLPVGGIGPPTCQPCFRALSLAADLKDEDGKVIRPGIVPLATRVHAVGPLPPAERAELEDLIASLESCP